MWAFWHCDDPLSNKIGGRLERGEGVERSGGAFSVKRPLVGLTGSFL